MLANCLRANGRPEEAIPLFERVYALKQRSGDKDQGMVAVSRTLSELHDEVSTPGVVATRPGATLLFVLARCLLVAAHLLYWV